MDNLPDQRQSVLTMLGMRVLVDPKMAADEIKVVSTTWDASKREEVVLDYVTIKNIG